MNLSAPQPVFEFTKKDSNEEEAWPLDFQWAQTPSLDAAPDAEDDYFKIDSMLTLDDFQYPSWQEFDNKLRLHERSNSKQLVLHQTANHDNFGDTDDFHNRSPLCASPTLSSHIMSPLSTPVSPSASPLLSCVQTHELLAGSDVNQQTVVPVDNLPLFSADSEELTLENVLAAFVKEKQPFTLKRVMYLDWIKPKLVANPPVPNNSDPRATFYIIPRMLSDAEKTYLKLFRQDNNARWESFDFEAFVASIINKSLLLHFMRAGSFHLRQCARQWLLIEIGWLLYDTKIDHTNRDFARLHRLVEQRVKYFRDVLSRQFKNQKLSRPEHSPFLPC
eukprot:Gregarina_sp_Poly_1__3858@NODE_2150_length_2597_cov_158_277075_g1385_i0_p1_GENE_NODE_2150_length_2597_cov_158_277075_g1385_i0NODE_2150_length_2597_cov_158_277075_g1385_i0_p1_ORF_typecomplete_len333_score49_81_NODE_2150_length_2597_cov_158_277075_g1385_i015042502